MMNSAIWPSSEETVHIALIPTCGEMAIVFFRGIIKVACKAAAWDALHYIEAQDIPQFKTSKGIRIGGAIW